MAASAAVRHPRCGSAGPDARAPGRGPGPHPAPRVQKEAVLGMLRGKLQEEGLRTYLLAYGRFYSSLSIAQLCDMFELPQRKVHAVVSRLIADDGLPASHDQPTGTIVVHHVEPTRLQTLAGTFSDKASLLVDLNERALAMRTGTWAGRLLGGWGEQGARARVGPARDPSGVASAADRCLAPGCRCAAHGR